MLGPGFRMPHRLVREAVELGNVRESCCLWVLVERDNGTRRDSALDSVEERVPPSIQIVQRMPRTCRWIGAPGGSSAGPTSRRPTFNVTLSLFRRFDRIEQG